MLKCLNAILLATLLAGVCTTANPAAQFVLILFGCTLKSRDKTVEMNFCGNAKVVPTLCINAYYGVVGVLNY